MAIPLTKWVTTTFREGREVKPEALSAVADFTLLWGVFEGAECDARGSIDKYRAFAERVAGRISRAEVEHLLQYWRERYVSEGDLNDRFNALCFRPSDEPNLARAVLLGEPRSLQEEVLVLVLITFRLRNNLFHGLKVITKLNQQTENLLHGITVLQSLMPHSGRYIYLDAA